MKNKNTMESGDDYDQMLRAMFDSCDTVGLGLLTPKDFEKLCRKLSIQEHITLLSEVLFPETNKRKLLSYDSFRDTLILFLTGDPGFGNFESEVKPDSRSDPEECWEDINDYKSENRIDISPKSGIIEDYSLEVIPEYPDDVFVTGADENYNCTSENRSHFNESSKAVSSSPTKNRTYGRKSKPDMDLLRNRESDSNRPVVLREVQVENTKHFAHLDESSPENSPWKAVEVSFIAEECQSPIVMKEEEFTGRGNDDDWKNPDSEWMSDANCNTAESDVTAVKTELENAWCRVVGDHVSGAMDETQLGSLCAELGLGHLCREEDIAQLFAALDSDNDGLVTFEGFSQRMSMFMGGTGDQNPDITRHETADQDYPNMDCANNPQNTEEDDDVFSRKRPTVTSPGGDFTSTDYHSTSRPLTPAGVGYVGESAIDVNPAKVDTTPSRLSDTSFTSSPAASVTSSEGSQTPDSRRGLSLDSDTSPLCPPVVSVEPRQLAAINRGRRRRRCSAVAASNPAGLRQQRKKSSRSIPLPHYHPASIRKLEKLPLSYLTEENERYISLDSLQQTWETEGLEESYQVLEALELSSTEQSISVEALSEVLDMEMEQNLIQKAALILYKRGINHYRSKYDHERSERSKQESQINHLVSQLQEQEERFEKSETNFRKQAEEMETKYKVEIRGLIDELTSAQTRLKECEQESLTTQRMEFEELTKKYEKSHSLVEDLKTENERLLQQKEEVEARLLEAEDAMMKMQEDLDAACRGVALSSRQLASQRKQYTELLRMYEEQTQSIQDSNDELFDRLQQTRRRWSSPCTKSKSARRKTLRTSPSLRQSDTSSYSSASDESHHHLSTCQLYVSETPKSVTSSPGQFMTSSPSTEQPEDGLKSDAFAFLTPTTSHAKSRVQSFASLAIAPPTLNSENCLDI